MTSKEHVENFSESLIEILKNELDLGNKIVETSNGWPSPNSIIIFLKKPFLKQYSIDGVEFREVNDPHWWKSEYFDKKSNHILACKYE